MGVACSAAIHCVEDIVLTAGSDVCMCEIVLYILQDSVGNFCSMRSAVHKTVAVQFTGSGTEFTFVIFTSSWHLKYEHVLVSLTVLCSDEDIVTLANNSPINRYKLYLLDAHGEQLMIKNLFVF